jgi:protein-S-isoprenylcysteine O-methyltransferase Ste14
MTTSTGKIGDAKPLFELKGKAARIELSAWLAWLSLFLGVLMIGQNRLTAAYALSPLPFWAIAAAIIVFFLCVFFIQRHMGFAASANSFGTPNQLVTSGIFQYSRNPIYLAFWLPLLALCLVWWPAGVFALFVYIVSMNLTVLRTEERDLVNLFGQTYVDYAAKVPRWILW